MRDSNAAGGQEVSTEDMLLWLRNLAGNCRLLGVAAGWFMVPAVNGNRTGRDLTGSASQGWRGDNYTWKAGSEVLQHIRWIVCRVFS